MPEIKPKMEGGNVLCSPDCPLQGTSRLEPRWCYTCQLWHPCVPWYRQEISKLQEKFAKQNVLDDELMEKVKGFVNAEHWLSVDMDDGTAREGVYIETGFLRNLIKRIEELKRQLTLQRDNNHRRNLELDALHYVWCDGGCTGGTHRWTEKELTQEIVETAVHCVDRLVAWWNNHEFRKLDNLPDREPKPYGWYRKEYNRLEKRVKELEEAQVARDHPEKLD